MSSSSPNPFPRIKTRNGDIQGFPGGSLTELARVEDAAFILLNYDEGYTIRVVRVGDFAIRMVMRSRDSKSIVLITTCMVEGLHWPLTRDAPVIRVGDYSFAFALPDLLYGVSFPRKVGEDTMDSLGMVFRKFGFYEDNRGDAPIGKSHLLEKHQPTECLMPQLAFKTWTLNPNGILFLMQMLSHITTQKESAYGGKGTQTMDRQEIKFPILEEYDI
ncbi:uncharacterized protein LOC131159947 isoform X2 [Malania oleifera]|uniref:uncharacterized protein LOC131159947 isoform X2 n=1 Tax=Malania oleifera TaxID=397392 RepID=UPI0025AE3E5A|nr:uncharacterized protein LOC131159947 isoform X2 [Malania oleifera]